MARVGPTVAWLILQVGREVSDRTQKLVASFVGPGSGVRLETVDRTHNPEAASSALQRFFGEYTSGTVREQLVETHGLHFAVDGFNDVHCCAHSSLRKPHRYSCVVVSRGAQQPCGGSGRCLRCRGSSGGMQCGSGAAATGGSGRGARPGLPAQLQERGGAAPLRFLPPSHGRPIHAPVA